MASTTAAVFFGSAAALPGLFYRYTDSVRREMTVAGPSPELSKLHEEVLRGTLAELAAHFAATAARGEIVLCVAGADDRRVPQGSEDR